MTRHKLQPLSFEEHQRIGQQLTTMDRDLIHIAAQLGNAYPKDRGYTRSIERIIGRITLLRNSLDKVVFDEFPDKTNIELNDVYFGPQKEDRQN